MAAEKMDKKIRKKKMEEKKVEKPEYRFSKEQLLSSERFRDRRDMVNALLLPNETYTIAEVEERMEAYRKGKVK